MQNLEHIIKAFKIVV